DGGLGPNPRSAPAPVRTSLRPGGSTAGDAAVSDWCPDLMSRRVSRPCWCELCDEAVARARQLREVALLATGMLAIRLSKDARAQHDATSHCLARRRSWTAV